MKQRSAAMLLSLAVWSCGLQPAAGPRPGPEPSGETRGVAARAGQLDGGGGTVRGGRERGSPGLSAEREGGVVAAARGVAPADTADAAQPEDDAAAPWVDPSIDLEYMAL